MQDFFHQRYGSVGKCNSYWKLSHFSVDFVGFHPGKSFFFGSGAFRFAIQDVEFVCCCFLSFRLKPRLAKGDKDFKKMTWTNVCWIPILWVMFWKAFLGIAINHHRLNAFGFENAFFNPGTCKSIVFLRWIINVIIRAWNIKPKAKCWMTYITKKDFEKKKIVEVLSDLLVSDYSQASCATAKFQAFW